MRGIRRFLRIPSLYKALFLSSLMLSLAWSASPPIANSQSNWPTPTLNQRVQEGVNSYQSGNYLKAIAQWESALDAYPDQTPQNTAIIRENLARTLQQVGQPHKALVHWQRLVQLYRQLNRPQAMGRMLTEEAQTYIQLGQPESAITRLCNAKTIDTCAPNSALETAKRHVDQPGELAALGALGNAYREQGQYDQAINVLDTGLALSQTYNTSTYESAMLHSLGNTLIQRGQANERRAEAIREAGLTQQEKKLATAAQADYQIALKHLNHALTLARQQKNTLGQLNTLRVMIPLSSRRDPPATTLLQAQAVSLLAHLPPTQDKVFAMVDLATQPSQLPSLINQRSPKYCPVQNSSAQTLKLLKDAITTAQAINDRRGESFALGALGHFYECQKQYTQALSLTQSARLIAEGPQNQDSLYLWEWQMGRILQVQGREAEAIRTYEQAIATLEKIRSRLLSANRELQFDFRDTVEPIYRELAALHLKTASPLTSVPRNQLNQTSIRAALNTIDSLKLAELQDYFGNDCVITSLPQTSVNIIAKSQETAVLSTLILGDRTAVILTLPNGSQKINWIQASTAELRTKVNDYRRGLERFFEPYQPQAAQQIYDWVIRPFAKDLEAAQVQTLIFVQDGIFRSVPMAALHDGQQFLIQKYAVGTTLSLSLTDPKPLNFQNLQILALGLTEASMVGDQTFPALTYVDQEINAIKRQRPNTRILLNQDFTRDRLQQELERNTFPIVHMATHAQFSQNPDETFLVIGENQTLTLQELDTLLRQSTRLADAIELLALTACQTAVGDDRAALGLAGVAIQAGARSAIASLWSINDAATADLMGDFYATLKTSRHKAQALQRAQLDLLNQDNFSHPAYWAPFVLIGNWL